MTIPFWVKRSYNFYTLGTLENPSLGFRLWIYKDTDDRIWQPPTYTLQVLYNNPPLMVMLIWRLCQVKDSQKKHPERIKIWKIEEDTKKL